MSEYGVVVEKYDDRFGIWQLFRGAESCLASLDSGVCADPLRVGDIVQAESDGEETRIRRSLPFPDSVWSDRDRIVIRSIVSFNSENTADRGEWKDYTTGLSSVLLVSHDIGLVVAPLQWYNREFFDANEFHLLYAEFLPRKLINTATGENIDVFWTIVENRISLPAVPSSDQVLDNFVGWDLIRKVPVLTILRQGNAMLTWSYALGYHMAVIIDNDESIDIGQWLMVTVIRSPSFCYSTYGCTCIVVKYAPVVPYSQPDIVVDGGKISMALTLNRVESSTLNGGFKLWHEHWGLPVSYDNKDKEWIRGEAYEFRATVEVVVIVDEKLGFRRVSLKVMGPAVVPLHSPPPIVESLTEVAVAEEEVPKLEKEDNKEEKTELELMSSTFKTTLGLKNRKIKDLEAEVSQLRERNEEVTDKEDKEVQTDVIEGEEKEATKDEGPRAVMGQEVDQIRYGDNAPYASYAPYMGIHHDGGSECAEDPMPDRVGRGDGQHFEFGGGKPFVYRERREPRVGQEIFGRVREGRGGGNAAMRGRHPVPPPPLVRPPYGNGRERSGDLRQEYRGGNHQQPQREYGLGRGGFGGGDNGQESGNVVYEGVVYEEFVFNNVAYLVERRGGGDRGRGYPRGRGFAR